MNSVLVEEVQDHADADETDKPLVAERPDELQKIADDVTAEEGQRIAEQDLQNDSERDEQHADFRQRANPPLELVEDFHAAPHLFRSAPK